MSAMQRRKGASAERELVRLLCEHLDSSVTRNLSQSRDGGHDLLGVGPFALECKRQEKLSLVSWWRQACDQAAQAGLIPALAYRQSKQPWKFVLPLAALIREPVDCQATAVLDLDGFIVAVRLAAPVTQ